VLKQFPGGGQKAAAPPTAAPAADATPNLRDGEISLGLDQRERSLRLIAVKVEYSGLRPPLRVLSLVISSCEALFFYRVPFFDSIVIFDNDTLKEFTVPLLQKA